MPRDFPTEFLKGTLDLAIMSVLLRERTHGYGIAQKLEELSESVVTVSPAAIYPVLHRLERKGYVRATWTIGSHNRRAKVYEPTDHGRKWMGEREQQWTTFREAIDKILSKRFASPSGVPCS
jgi:PadR family transcriptional regulator, regulatory protein PadR